MGVLRRYVAIGTTGIARVGLPLNLVLKGALVLLDLLPGLDLISALLIILIAGQGHRGGAEDEGRCEGNFGLGQHGCVSFAAVNPLTEPFGRMAFSAEGLPVNIDRTVQSI
jgi:hypothetical protein